MCHEVLERGLSAWVEDDWFWEKEKREGEERNEKINYVCVKEREVSINAFSKGWKSGKLESEIWELIKKIGKLMIKNLPRLTPQCPLHRVISQHSWVWIMVVTQK